MGLAESLLVAGDECVSLSDTQHQSASDSALDLAQKYEEYFGRARLHQFLIESVRNEDFSPGEIHHRLLKLPWRDVFTTNWDTLLEQCLPVPEQSYDLVTSVDHLPVTAPPRIVKLHGSFPGTFPLVITRTDYDTYPVVFAPFFQHCTTVYDGDRSPFARFLGRRPELSAVAQLGATKPR